MRYKKWIIGFVITFSMVVAIALQPAITDRLWASFSEVEATAKIGRRVRNRPTKDFQLMKCPEESFCERVKEDEMGKITGAEKVPDGGYFLVVLWDQPNPEGKPLISYLGRYSLRKSVSEE